MFKLGVTAAIFALIAGPALAQPKTLTVAGYGGVWDQHLRKEVFPAFEAKHGVKIELWDNIIGVFKKKKKDDEGK